MAKNTTNTGFDTSIIPADNTAMEAAVVSSSASFQEEAQAIISGVEDSSNIFFSSFVPETKEQKVAIYNALSGEGGTIKDMLNKELKVKDVVVCVVSIRNENTGEMATVPRTTLILEDGKMVSASSWGVYNSIKRLTMFYPGLHFEEPVTLLPVEVKTKNGFTLNLRMI